MGSEQDQEDGGWGYTHEEGQGHVHDEEPLDHEKRDHGASQAAAPQVVLPIRPHRRIHSMCPEETGGNLSSTDIIVTWKCAVLEFIRGTKEKDHDLSEVVMTVLDHFRHLRPDSDGALTNENTYVQGHLLVLSCRMTFRHFATFL